MSMFTEELQEWLLLLGETISLRATGVSSGYSHMIPERSKKRRGVRAPLVPRKLGYLENLASEVGGRKNYGQVCFRSDELNYKFKELVRVPGFLSNATILRKKFIIVRSRSAVFPGDRSWQGRCGGLTPSFLARGTSDELVCGSNPADRYG